MSRPTRVLPFAAFASVLCTLVLFSSPRANAEEFSAGSLIIPMDTDYQDDGMFKAFGLVYQLLLADVPVHWAIREDKELHEADFLSDAVDVQTDAVIEAHGYRAGPFVIDAANAAAASPIIEAWQAENVTTVHEATSSFESDVAETLVSAPTIAMFADGNEDIARSYLLAAGIPDSTGDLTWPDDSPDMLSPSEVAGPTDEDHRDGALFDEDGIAIYCQLMSMHWGVRDSERNPEVVAEVRQFLRFPTHFFAECQAVNAFENNVNGRFLTPFGFEIDNVREGDPVDFYNADSPFAQTDGVYEVVRGSERSYTPCGNEECSEPGEYLAGGVVMITEQGTPEGTRDVWMTGFLDGNCPPDAKECEDEDGARVGKVSYLGGHEYSTDLPISENPRSGGTRLFLQSLFEAPCATLDGQPHIELLLSGPSVTTDGTVAYEIRYENVGGSVAREVAIHNPLPIGSTLVDAPEATEADGGVTWQIGSLEPGTTDTLVLVLTVETRGASIENIAEARWLAGVNERNSFSNSIVTIFGDDRDSDGIADAVDICPDHPNPAQNLDSDPESCGACGTICDEACVAGLCAEEGDDVGDGDVGADTGEDVGTDTEGDAELDTGGDSGDVADDPETDSEDPPDATGLDAHDDADAEEDQSGTTDTPTAESDLANPSEDTGGISSLDNSEHAVSGSGCSCRHTPAPPHIPSAIGVFILGLLLRRRDR